MSYSPTLLHDRRHLFYDEPRPFGNNLLQICKVFDGLFMGNHHAGKELQFLTNNKISLVVNLAHTEIHPHSKHITVMHYDFAQKKPGQEPTLALSLVLEITAAIEHCLRVKQESVVIVSKTIDSRVIAFSCLYLMIKFRWSSNEAFTFIHQRFPNSHLLPQYLKVLESFNAHKERDKLSQAFQTEETQIEKLLLTNTIQNSHMINMPNFHGLTFQKEGSNAHQIDQANRKVKFKKQIQIINNHQQKKHSTSKLSSKQVQKINKLTRVQKKFRQFIKQKCHLSKETSINTIKPAIDDERDDMVFVKSKDISCRIPRKRAASKSEDSPFCQKSQQKLSDKTADDLLIFEFKQEDSLFKKSQPLKMFIPLEINLKSLQGDQQDGFLDMQSVRREKNYILHNNKRYRLPKKCHTEESMVNTYLQPQKYKRLHQKTEGEQGQSSNFMFKISKSSKTSSKKFKINNTTIKTLGKQSQKCIKIGEEQPHFQSFSEKKEESSPQCSHQKIINFNLNVQIQNINVIRQKTLRDIMEQKKIKMFTRPYQQKKFSKAMSGVIQGDN